MDTVLWEKLALQAASRPRFLASRWPPSAWPGLWWRLGLDNETGLRLLVCGSPRPQHWASDVAQLAEFTGCDPLQLEVELLIAEVHALRAVCRRP
jgi:hypothetical protein